MCANWVCAFAGLSVLALVGGCGGSGSDSDNDGGGGACQMVVTGAVSGTYPCSQDPYVLQIGGGADSVFTAIGLGEIGKANAGGFGLSAAVAGAPAAGTYTYTSDEADKAWAVDFSRVSGSTSQDWVGGGGPITTARGGTCSLTFTKVSAPTVQAGGGSNTYVVHGTLSATLSADVSTGASGEVNVKLTF